MTGKKHYCANPEHKKDPVCICRIPMNYSLEMCKQDMNWWTKTETKKKNGKIVGGELAPGDAYPWFARMMRRSGSWAGCGGMLVAPEYVLTAAHCAVLYQVSTSAVLIGAVCPYQNDNCGQPSQTINAAAILVHPEYNDVTLDNDFALMKLVSRADATPVPMDQNKYVPNYSPGKRGLWAIGFGTTSAGGSTSSKLRHVEVAFVPSNTCNSMYSGGITDNMICAADPNQDSCQGDSGGPLYDEANNALVGVVSWGYGCADEDYPGVYSKVSAKWDWIESNICEGHSNPKPSFCNTEPTKSPSPTPAPTVSPTIEPTPAPTPCGDGKIDVKVSFTPDQYTNENTWEVTDSTGTPVGENGDLIEGITNVSNLCLDSSDCYTFTFTDSWGDGLEEPGALTVSVNNISVLSIIQYEGFFVKAVNFGQCTNSCSSEDFLGRTVFLPLSACYKVDFFPQGSVSRDSSDQSCSNTDEHNADVLISEFDGTDNQNIYFTSGPGVPFSGKFNFLEDPTLAGMSVGVNDLADNTFDLTLTVPSCDMGAPYPCIEQSLLGSTVFVPIMNICFKIELFEGGEFVGDTSDSTCSKDEVDHTPSLKASEFDYAAGHKVYFAGAYTGSFALNMDPSVTAIEAAIVSLDQTARTFEFSLTFPSCDPLISMSPNSSPNNECSDIPDWVDSYGDGCDWYIPDSRCDDFGSWYSNLGYTATEACCVCGGGE